MNNNFLYFFIYLLNIYFINAENESLINKVIKKIISKNYYEKIINKYNVSLKIIENGNITNEYFINTSDLWNNHTFDFLYSGIFFYLNDTNLDILFNQNNQNYNEHLILLIKSNNTFNNFINKIDKKLIKNLTKSIIVPKNSIDDIDLIVKYCFSNLSIYLIELEEDIFNHLINKYINKYNKNNYLVKLISKRYELFIDLNFNLHFIIMLPLSLCYIFYKVLIRENIINESDFLFKIFLNLRFKCIIILFLYIQYFNFTDLNGFYLYQDLILIIFIFTLFLIVFSKFNLMFFYSIIFLGNGLYLINNLNSKFFIFLIILNISLLFLIRTFVPSFKILEISRETFLYIQLLLLIFYYSLKNIIFLINIKNKLKKYRRNNKYIPSIKFKLNIVIFQFIAFIIYAFSIELLKGYLSLKKECYVGLEENIFFEILDDYYIIFIAVIYFPIFRPYKFKKNIIFSKIKFPNYTKLNYRFNISKQDLNNKKEINEFIKNQKKLIVLSPKVFLNKNDRLFDTLIKIGKINYS